MTDDSPLFVLEVENGTAVPEAIRLSPGNELPPMSVGLKGQWHVAGPGVRDVHGYVWFDGADLYLRSASADDPFRVGDEVVCSDWQRILPPCRISAGELALNFTIARAAAATTGVPSRGAGRSKAPGAFLRLFFSPAASASGSNESPPASADRAELQATRIERPGAPPEALRRSPVVTRPDGSESPREPPDELVSTRPSVAPPPAAPSELPEELLATRVPGSELAVQAAELPDELLATRFDEAPLALSDPAVQGLRAYDEAPLALAEPAARGLLAQDEAPLASSNPVVQRVLVQAARTTVAREARAPIDVSSSRAPAPIDVPPSQSSASSTKNSRPLGGAVRELWNRTPPMQKAILLLLPLAFLAVHISMAPRVAPVRRQAAPPASSASSAATTSLLPPVVSAPMPPAFPIAPAGGKTRARMAADAVAAGAYSDAVARYDELAVAYPDQLVYRETARILRTKLGGTADAAPPAVVQRTTR